MSNVKFFKGEFDIYPKIMAYFSKQICKSFVEIHPMKFFPIKILSNRYSNKTVNEEQKWYETLGLPNKSDQEAVRSAYIKLAKRYHPDSSNLESDINKFQEIESAYRNLLAKFSRERYNKDKCAGEYGLYYKEGHTQPEEFDIEHTAPQHRQYLNYEGYGSGTPFQRQKQFEKYRANKASENVQTYRINKQIQNSEKSVALKENRKNKKIQDVKTRYGMDRLVEDLIQQSINRGEFDNLRGIGKPINNLKRSHNPYVDFITHKMNEVLIEGGFSPAWINLQKEISEQRENILIKLMKTREKIGSFPLTMEENKFWEETKNSLKDEVKVLNSKIDYYNLVVPLMNKQQFHFNLSKEAENILTNSKFDKKKED